MSILKIKDSQGNWVGVPTVKGDNGNGISSTVLNDDYTLTLTFTDGTTYTTPSIRGNKGDKGDKGDTGEVTQAEFDELSGKVSDLKEGLTLWCVEDGVLKRHSPITKVIIETENDFELLEDFPSGTVAFLADYSKFWYKKTDGTWAEIVSSSESKKAIVGQAIVGQAVIGD